MYNEDDFLPLSALQHLQYCPRQCALIHVEQVWIENRYTAEGRELHRTVDAGGHRTRSDLRQALGLLLRSLHLGLTGRADLVEFRRRPDGSWTPYPVEFKRGRPKPDNCDRVQLCAQAMCLEEMLETPVPKGALFYGQSRRREDVLFDAALRSQTEDLARRLHALVEAGSTPIVAYSAKCDRCSVLSLCQPKSVGAKSASRYLARMIREIACNDC